jgi:hypothetical protein
MDHQTEYPFNRCAEKTLSRFGDLDSPAVERRPRSCGGRVEDLGVGGGGDNPPSGVLISMFRRQAHRNVGAPLASTVIIRRLRRLRCPNQTTRTCDRLLRPGEVSIGQGDLHSPAMPGEVDLCPLDLSPHLLETKSLKRELEPVGVGDFRAAPYQSGLVLHNGQRTIICALDDLSPLTDITVAIRQPHHLGAS